MVRTVKILFYIFVTIFAIWALLAIILSQIGLETKRFNSLIVEQIKKYNEDLDLDIKKVKIYLNISELTNPKIKVRSNEPTLILGKNKIELESIKTEIDILSYFKNNFIIDKFVVVTKDNKIKDLISIASLEKPSLIIYNIFICLFFLKECRRQRQTLGRKRSRRCRRTASGALPSTSPKRWSRRRGNDVRVLRTYST